ncbi:MAG: hypothetical protein WBX17_07475 [Microbacterium sp.]
MPPRSAAGLHPRLARLALALALAGALVVGGASEPATAYDEGTIVALANDARAASGLGGLMRNG